MAAKRATTVIPIVFAAAIDPVGSGLVTSLARPGGNVTGLSIQQADTASKRLSFLREAVPGLRHVAVMGNTSNPSIVEEMREVQTAAGTLGLECATFEIRQVRDIVPAFTALKPRAQALYLAGDPLIDGNRFRIGVLALAARLPTIWDDPEPTTLVGLMSYGPNFAAQFRRAGDLIDKVLRGTKSADIPVEQPVKFDLVINLIVANALGLDVPATLLARADEVIE
jgi:putative ABC transport system substrate-binding protein